MVFGTVRWKRLLEWHLKRHLRKIGNLPLPVKMVLLLGCYQILFLSRIPFFAAVNEGVEAVKTLGHPWAKGLVNAVLRKTSLAAKEIPEGKEFFDRRCGKNFLNCLSVFSSHPHWMAKRWRAQWGKKEAISICVNNNIHPPLTLRVNTLRIHRDRLIDLLSKEGIEVHKGTVCPDALILKGFRGRIEGLPGFDQGLFQVQDEASQIVSLLLQPKPGHLVLDMCAGVGGKSTHIAAIMENKGQLTCIDTNLERLNRLEENTKRLGIEVAQALPAPVFLEDVKPKLGLFDRVLVDAPCSGTGVIRRHPDIKWNRTPDMIEELINLQTELLEKAASFLAPGGLLVYSVCSIEKEEGESIIHGFLSKTPSFSLVGGRKLIPSLPQSLVSQDGCVRIMPGQMGMDGFFAAAIRRQRHQ